MAAEAEGVGNAEGERGCQGLVGRIVQVALGVWGVEVDGRGDDTVAQGEDGCNGLRRAGRAEHVPVHRLRRTDVALVGEIAERDLAGLGLGQVVELGAGAVGIDVDAVLRGVEAGLPDGYRDALGLGGSVRPGCGHVVGVAGAAVAHHLGVDLRAARLGMLILLEDEHSGAVRHDEALPVGVEGERCVLGILGAGECLGVGERSKADGDGALVGTAGDDGVGIAVLNCPEGLSNGVGGGGAGRHYVDARSCGIVPYGNVAGRHVGDHSGDEERRDPLAGRVLEELAYLTDLHVESSDTGAYIDTQAEGVDVHVFPGGRQSGVFHGLVRCRHPVDGEPVLLAHEGLVYVVEVGVETLDAASYLDR